MKQKLALLTLVAFLSFGAKAQMEGYPTKKGTLVGFSLNAVDFKTVASFREKNSNRRKISDPKTWDYGLSLGYWRGITDHLDFSARLGGNFHSYAKDRGEEAKSLEFGAELEPSLHLRMFKDNNWINPFVSAGIGGGVFSSEWGAYVPFGIGFQFNFRSTTYMMLQANFRKSLSEDVLNDHMFYSLGLYTNIKNVPTPVVTPPVPPVVDRDGDGVNDEDDKCPDVPGVASLQGCPDRDGDGIADDEDKCPDVAGIAKYNGCPIPDTDGDGINDEEDKCPDVAGLARYQGCPIPDSDGDGVNDEEDKCPNRPGPADNMGCPVIAKEVIEKVNFAAKNVFFNTGSAKLSTKSYKSLDEVAKLMTEDPSLMMDIDGHTDAQGSDELNQSLSEKRANAVRDYLISKGIDPSRLKATGYGESRPIADNNTAAGRAKNRRTEMTVRNY
jgi:outer membrane protein OmpA-like peptidoglycan-associated protein